MSDCLYMDMGNTRIKWWSRQQNNYGVLDYSKLESELVSLRKQLGETGAVIIASVLGKEKTRSVVELLWLYLSENVKQCVVSREAVGVACAYQEPQKLGVDRWLAVLAVWNRYKSACQVVDLGTALTIDQIDDKGNHLGGFIVSGLELSINGLLKGTQNIRPDPLLFNNACLDPGKNTTQAVYHGALLAAVSIIETSYVNATKRNNDTKLILVGGDAALVGSHLRCDYQLVSNLVFQGMQLLESANQLIDAADAL